MLFHITYEIPHETRNTVQARFKETGGLPTEGVSMIGRWHCAQGLKGFVIAETSDAEAIAVWLQGWTDQITFEVTPVIDDEAAGRVIG